MFDFAWSELALIGALSVLLLGPKQLPETMRSLAKIVRKLRGLSAEFQGHFNEMVREAELEELRAQVQKLSSSSVQAEMTKLVDPTGEISNALQLYPAAAAEVRARIAVNVLPVARERVLLRTSGLGDDATIVGAAELAFAPLLKDPLGVLAGREPATTAPGLGARRSA